jgi:hypothetical protein
VRIRTNPRPATPTQVFVAAQGIAAAPNTAMWEQHDPQPADDD